MGNTSSRNSDDGETCLVDIFISDLTEEYSSIRKLYLREGNCFILLYSVTDLNSLLDIESTYNSIQTVRQDLKPPSILAGNKIDLTDDRQITIDKGIALATKLGIPFVEISAKTGENVQKLFETLIRHTPRSSIEYKVVILGWHGAGRSSVSERYVNNWFLTGYLPVCGGDYRKKVIVKDIPDEMKRLGMLKRKNRLFSGKSKRSLPEF